MLIFKYLQRKCTQLAKKILVLSMCLPFIITSQLLQAAEIVVQSGMSNFEMDLGTALLKVDQIDSNMQLTVSQKGALNVSKFRAKHVTIVVKNNVKTPKNPQITTNVLPNKINIALPVLLQAGVVETLTIHNGDNTYILQNITFNLEANNQSLKLALTVAESPWGVINTKLDIENQKPFKLNGFATLTEKLSGFSPKNEKLNSFSQTHFSEPKTPNNLHVDLSGSLQHLHFESKNVVHYANNQFSFHAINAETTKIKEINSVPTNETTLFANGDISLEGAYPFSIELSINQLNAAYLHPQLAGIIHLNANVKGVLSPISELKVTVQTNNSTLRGQALQLNADATLLDNKLTDINVLGKLASNKFKAFGGLSDTDSVGKKTIEWYADFNDIRSVGDRFAGALNAKGSVTAMAESLLYSYELTAKKLELPQSININDLQASGEISTAENGVLITEVLLKGLSQNKPNSSYSKSIDAKLSLVGSQKTHTLNASISNTSLADKTIGLNASVSGGFNSNGWQGKINSITSLDKKTIQLLAPAPVQFSTANGFNMQNFLLQINQGVFAVDMLILNQVTPAPYQFKSTGYIDKIALEDIQDYLFIAPSKLVNTLTMNGKWDIAVNDVINANISLWRESGDISVHNEVTENKNNIGLKAMRANIDIVNNVIATDLEIISSKSGYVRGKLKTSLSKVNNSFGLAKTAPLSLSLDANLNTLAWLPFPESVPDANADGNLQLSLNANGTVETPNLMGKLDGNNLEVTLPSYGIALKNGALQAQFDNQSLNISQLTFQGGKGTLSATGNANFSNAHPILNLILQADNFTALSRTDRLVVISGNGKVNVENNIMTLGGKFNVLNGLFELLKQDSPMLGDDIVVLGEIKAEKKLPTAINISELNINFGNTPSSPFIESEQFMLRGNGINAAISGSITLSGKLNEQLSANGALQVNGTYLAYGQLLKIEPGQINFSGPINNAGLNITAMRDTEPTKAGVKISGTLLVPTVKLVSVPEVPDSDKLSLLIIGQPMSQAGDSQLALLSLAAGALLSDGDSVPLQNRIANAIGLDLFAVKGSNTATYSVNVGKQLSSQVYLGYEKSLFGLLNVAKLTYKLTRRISVVTIAGSDSAVDLLYTFSFN